MLVATVGGRIISSLKTMMGRQPAKQHAGSRMTLAYDGVVIAIREVIHASISMEVNPS